MTVGSAKLRARDSRWHRPLALDCRHALRGLRRWPGVAVLTIALLALGTGLTTALVSLVSGVLLTPPPYADPSRLVLVAPSRIDGQPYRGPCTGRQCGDWSAAQSFESAATYFWIFDHLVIDDGSTSVEGLAVSPEYFQVIGRMPSLGRVFRPDETSARTHPVALISHQLWQRRFGADPLILGEPLTLSRHRTLTIVGVMPPGIRFLPAPLSEEAPAYDVNAMVDFWVPQSREAFPPDVPIWNAVARLRRGVSLDQARAELAAIAKHQAEINPALRGMTASVVPIQSAMNGDPARLLLPLLAAAVCVLVIACANACALQLARGLLRYPEFALQAALGATPGRLVRQILIEHLAIGMVSGTAGALFAYGALGALVALGASSIPRLDTVLVDLRLLGWSVGLAILSSLGAAAPTAWRILHASASLEFDLTGKSARVSSGGWKMLQVLTGLQMALTVALLAASGLLLRSLHNVATAPLGFETTQALTMMVTDVGDSQTFSRRALDRVAQVPGVTAAAFAWGLPLTKTGASTQVRFTPADVGITVPVRAVTPTFFGVLALPLVDGREFRDTDDPGAPPVAIINADAAKKYFPGVNPLGRVIDVPGWEGRRRTIVGVVADMRAQSPTEASGPEVYLPLAQAAAYSKHLVVRTDREPTALAGAIDAALREIEPTVAIESVKSFAQIRAESTAAHQLATIVVATFGGVAWLLAAAGVYGSLAWSVARRRRDLAIRAALGADRRDVLAFILGYLAHPLIGGTLAGIVLAGVLTRALRAWLFAVSPDDPVVLLSAGGMLLMLTLAATYFPARTAIRLDPNVVLRSE